LSDLLWWQYTLIALIFVWSGFVRTGLGFGGAVLALPFLLLIIDDPLIFLPIIAVHLLIFSGAITLGNHFKAKRMGTGGLTENVDWPYLKRTLKVMIIPKLIGVFGLLTLPNEVMSGLIFVIVIVYSIGYILNKPFKSNSVWIDNLFLMLGGYVSGTSLIAAPLVMAVYASHVAKEQLRDTLFVLWFILVVIKMGSFFVVGVDLQLIHHLWLLPCAFIGHLLGQRLHRYLVKTDSARFFKIIGTVLIITSTIGIARTFG